MKGFGLIILRVLMGTFCTALATLPTVSKAADLQDRPSVYPGLTCLSAPYDTSGDGAETRITELISTLRQSIASFPSLQKALRIRAPDICTYSTTFDARGFYDPVANLIALNANMTRGAQLAILIHELRHLDQESVGACPSPNLSMQETARAVFALEADANATVVLIAHALRKAGNPGPWEAIQGFPHYKDIADVFLESIEEINDPGLAMAEAFFAVVRGRMAARALLYFDVQRLSRPPRRRTSTANVSAFTARFSGTAVPHARRNALFLFPGGDGQHSLSHRLDVSSANSLGSRQSTECDRALPSPRNTFRDPQPLR